MSTQASCGGAVRLWSHVAELTPPASGFCFFLSRVSPEHRSRPASLSTSTHSHRFSLKAVEATADGKLTKGTRRDRDPGDAATRRGSRVREAPAAALVTRCGHYLHPLSIPCEFSEGKILLLLHLLLQQIITEHLVQAWGGQETKKVLPTCQTLKEHLLNSLT